MYKTQEQPMGQFRIGFSFFGFGDCFLFEEIHTSVGEWVSCGPDTGAHVLKPAGIRQIRHRKFSDEYSQAYTGHDPTPVKRKTKKIKVNEKHLQSSSVS